MKILKYLFFSLIGILSILIITMFVIGKQYHFETSTIINAPINKVYDQSSSSKNFNQWNPWMDLDPNITVTYQGNQGQIGDKYCWEGNEDVGKGCHVITDLIPNKKIATKMMFKIPFESNATSDLNFREVQGKTDVIWSMDCELDYPMNLMKLFMDISMKKSYDKGLNKLKSIVE